MISKAPLVLLLGLQLAALSLGQPTRSSSNACRPGTSPFGAAESCNQVFRCYPNFVSGVYWIRIKSTAGDTVKRLPCVRATHAGIEGGFLQVASFNASSERDAKCPSPLRRTRVTGTSGKTVCAAKSTRPRCTTVHYETFGIPYSVVCGKVVGFAKGSPKAFGATPPPGFSHAHPLSVDGVVITHGPAKRHLWTYAIGGRGAGTRAGACPCDAPPQLLSPFDSSPPPLSLPPPGIGSNYYCESVSVSDDGKEDPPKWHSKTPLWDGEECGGGEEEEGVEDRGGCCSGSGSPWFCRRLPVQTADSLDVNLCLDRPTEEKNIGLAALELRVY